MLGIWFLIMTSRSFKELLVGSILKEIEQSKLLTVAILILENI